MIAMVWHELRRRLGRSLAMGFAVLVAAAGFTVLTSSSDASKVQTVGNVQRNSLTAYDVLVRPTRSKTAQETSGQLIQPGFLSGIHGGISMAQWQQILHMSGVSVAAPMTVVGSTVLATPVQVDVTREISRTQPTTLRIDGTWRLPDGREQAQQPNFAYRTPRSITAPLTLPRTVPTLCRIPLTDIQQSIHQLISKMPGYLDCDYDEFRGQISSTYTPSAPKGHTVIELTFVLPEVLVAIDPVQESKLVGQRTSPTGSAMTGLARAAYTAWDGSPVAPALFAAQPARDTALNVTVGAMGAAGDRAMSRGPGNGLQPTALLRLPASPVAHDTITSARAQAALRHALRAYPANTPDSGGTAYGYRGSVWKYWTMAPPRWTGSGRDLTAEPVVNPLQSVWVDGPYSGEVPVGMDDRNYRTMTTYQPENERNSNPLSLVDAGSFDPAAFPGLRQLTAQLLSGWVVPPATGADAASRVALGNKPVQPSGNLAAMIPTAPTVMTSLAALPGLMNATGGDDSSPAGTPISAVRVKVAGVHGVDPTSRERVRLVAQRIAAMGLDATVVVGSSPTRMTLHQPAGNHGQHALVLHQWWVKLGVATTILKALDTKSLALFVLVLLVAGLCVANSAIASVRSRRTDLGVLACVGWTRAALFRLVVTELTAIALVAGAVASGLSLVLGAAFGTPVNLSRALLAVPASLLVTLVAGFVPAYLAARSDPMDAVRPAVTAPRTARTARSVTGLGWGNLGRSRTRTLLAVLGLVVATAAFTMLLAVAVGFQGAVVGTVLGDAVALQTRASDYAAAGATFALAGIGVGNLMYLNIRDRGAELATLRAVGWTEAALRRLLLTEGALIGALGGVIGAVLGLAAAVAFLGSMPFLVLAAAVATALAAVLISMIATVLASTLLLRLPTATLLTE